MIYYIVNKKAFKTLAHAQAYVKYLEDTTDLKDIVIIEKHTGEDVSKPESYT